MKRRIQGWLASPRLPIQLGILALLLTLPALGIGWQLDDHYHRLLLTGQGPPGMTEWQVFSGPPQSEELHRYFVNEGIYPWWVSDGFRLSLLRPLSVLAARVDYWLWPDSAALMHLHSLLWLAALVTAVAMLYRRMMAPGWVAGLAALLYAIDDAHAAPAVWIANRNALLACLFGILSLIAHDRWRRGGGPANAWLAPLLLAAGLASGEVALGTAAYLFAYAVCLETGAWHRRLGTLLPAGVVLLGWAVVYRLGDYGAHGSGMYIDPLGDAATYARALFERAPLNLLGQWSPLPADLGALLPPDRLRVLWWLAVGLSVALAWLLGPLVRREPIARFWLVGMLLSLLPISAVFPSNRLLFFVGLGAMGLMARFLAVVWSSPNSMARAPKPRTLACVAAVALTIVHLPVAVVGTIVSPISVRRMGLPSEVAVATIPADPALERQELVLLNAPDYLTFVTHIPTLLTLERRPAPLRVRALSAGPTRVTVARLDASSLRLSIDRGLYAGPLGRLFRDRDRELEAGDRLKIDGLEIVVEGLDRNGDPNEIVYSFVTPLEDSARRWMHWVETGWEEIAPPPIGETLRLEAPLGPFDLFY